MLSQPRSVSEARVEIDDVRCQLERLLASPLFNQSRRYSKLLRYIVEQSLEGQAGHLKERTLGIEVFERDSAYDTNADPVVRTTVAQLRRRIAQYYSQPEHARELVIDLPVGAYVPVFHHPLSWEAEPAAPCPPQAEHADLYDPAATPVSRVALNIPHRPRSLALILCGLLAAVALTFAWLHVPARQSAVEAFWEPVWNSSSYVLLVIGEASSRELLKPLLTNAAPTIRNSLAANSVAWPDAITLSSLAGIVKINHKACRLQRSDYTSFEDMRNASAVLVGGFNNQWIMRLQKPLRFRYQTDSTIGWIADREHPSRRNWAVDFDAPFATFDTDYGVITRFVDPMTERTVVIASGIASFGTIASGEFLTTERYMEMVRARAPKNWKHMNLQVVFSTSVINGNSGAPRILAAYFW